MPTTFLDSDKDMKWEMELINFSCTVADNYEAEVLMSQMNEQKRVIIDWEKMTLDTQEWLMHESGATLMSCIADLEKELPLDTDIDGNVLKLGFNNFPRTIDMDRVGSPENAGKLVQIEGTIGGIAAPSSYASEVVWRCTECGTMHTKKYDFFETASKKHLCPTCATLTYNEVASERKIDYQIMQIVRPVEIVGRTPETLLVVLKGDLVEFGDAAEKKLLSGNRVKIVGISKDLPPERGKTTRKSFIDVMSWFVEREYLKLSDEDVAQIKELSKSPTLKQDLIDSTAPYIIGHDELKQAVLLMAVGGVPKFHKDGTPIRSTIHVLIIADPAVAKTQLGLWVSHHVPKARYAVTSTMSKSGFGVSLQRDDKLDAWYVIAGVTLLANDSIAVIDEVDKATGEDLNQLDQVMESEMIVLTKVKAGNFPAHTSILGLGNPKFGRFDSGISLSEQFGMQEQTLSRFDLKFAILDKVDPVLDSKIFMSQFEEPPSKIDEKLMTKYIYYARQMRPEMNEEAQKIMNGYYSELRSRTEGQGGVVAVTPRQGNTLRRLSEAFAKLRLSDTVTKEDVENGVEIINTYLKAFGYDARTNVIDIDMAEGRKSANKRELIYKVLDIIKGQSNILFRKYPTEEMICEHCDACGINSDFVLRTALPELLKAGEIWNPTPSTWAPHPS